MAKYWNNFVKWFILKYHEHKWHFWQTTHIGSDAWDSHIYFHRECLICELQEALGSRKGYKEIPEKSVFIKTTQDSSTIDNVS